MKVFLIVLILLGQSSHATENLLGRLFHTPQERDRLDVLRQQNPAVDSQENLIYTIDGEVRRSSGQDTHWINGEARNGRLASGMKIPPGDRMDSRNGAQQRLLGNGQLHIKHPAP